MKGTIFDIRRFSTHDGSGIRTTVFFKGCPLSCAWCHNPEGISGRRRPLHFENKCIGCGICCGLSRNGGMERSEGKVSLHAERTEDWDAMIDACPTGALVWDSREVTVGEVLKEAEKDKPFYRYGGGVTLSGGEPLLQPGFARELLRELQRSGIHTAVETALHVDIESVKMVLPYLDHIYADMKLFDPSLHEQFVGMPNQRIRENIRFLLTSDKREDVTIRTPMIPHYTATSENIGQISRFLAGIYPDVSYELLNYNPLAEAKYHLVDRTYCFEENPKRYDARQMEGFAQIAVRSGLKNVKIDV